MGRTIICFLALIGKTTLRETLFINDLAKLCYHDLFFDSKFCVTFSISFPVNVIFLRFICKYWKTTPFKLFIPRAKKTKRKNLGSKCFYTNMLRCSSKSRKVMGEVSNFKQNDFTDLLASTHKSLK